jgi:ribonuclease T2
MATSSLKQYKQGISMLIRIAIAIALAIIAPLMASAEDKAGDFDFYVLALSWSPSYCAISGGSDNEQCGIERHGFIVHGLWPQYEAGYPEYCRSSMSRRLPNSARDAIFDIMPSTGLIRHQWKKHGICTGLAQSAYFEFLRLAFDKISIPEGFIAPARDKSRDPAAIEAAFITANPGLSANGIAVTCKQRRLADVRICLTRDLEFRDCHEVDRRACGNPMVEVPGVR